MVEHDTKGVKIVLEDERIIGLYTLCLSSNTARPLDVVGVPRKAYNSFIFQQNLFNLWISSEGQGTTSGFLLYRPTSL